MPSLCGSSIFQQHKDPESGNIIFPSFAFADSNSSLSFCIVFYAPLPIILRLNTVLVMVSTQQPPKHLTVTSDIQRVTENLH